MMEPTDGGADAQLPGLTSQELDLLKKVFSSPLDIPLIFKNWMVSYLEANPPSITLSQVQGFTSFAAQISRIRADEGTASATFVDLTTVGPEIQNLPAGTYVFIFGALCGTAVTSSTDHLGISYSGAAVVSPDDVLDVPCDNGVLQLGVYASVHTFTDAEAANNYATVKYASASGTADFRNRWLVAIRTA